MSTVHSRTIKKPNKTSCNYLVLVEDKYLKINIKQKPVHKNIFFFWKVKVSLPKEVQSKTIDHTFNYFINIDTLQLRYYINISYAKNAYV